MAFMLVRFVEDLVWHVCPKSHVKKSNEELVMAKYGGYFYPALLIIKGDKNELLAVRNKYMEQDEILQKYFKFVPILAENTTNGARCLREAANNCNADKPALLRGTKLRKHIATISQALNLTDNDLSIIADYMGHNIDVHRHFYRLPNEAIHLAKVSRLLYALDTNEIDKYKGKSLDEINFDADLEREVESDTDIEDPHENRSKTIESTMPIQDDTEEIYSSKTTKSIVKDINNSRSSHTTVQKRKEECSDSEGEECWRKSKRQKRGIRRLPSISPEKLASQPSNDIEEQWTPERRRRKASRIYTERRPWKTPEKYAMRLFFKTHLTETRLPTNTECANAIAKNSVLRQRSLQQVKLWVSNEIKRRSKNGHVRKLFD